MLVIEHDQNYPSFVVSALFQKIGGEEGPLIRGKTLILNFGRYERRLFEGGVYLREALIGGFTVLLNITM